jgi:hypothetical protein
MGFRLFDRKNIFFEEFHQSIDAADRSNQAQEENRQPAEGEKFIQQEILRQDEENRKEYEDQKLFHI